jgi:hypothetical protein
MSRLQVKGDTVIRIDAMPEVEMDTEAKEGDSEEPARHQHHLIGEPPRTIAHLLTYQTTTPQGPSACC